MQLQLVGAFDQADSLGRLYSAVYQQNREDAHASTAHWRNALELGKRSTVQARPQSHTTGTSRLLAVAAAQAKRQRGRERRRYHEWRVFAEANPRLVETDTWRIVCQRA